MDFSTTYVALGERFSEKSQPTPVQSPQLILWNESLAEQLQLPQDLQQDAEALAQIFSGNRIPNGADPIATAYAGHQFGQFNPQLGDGRAHLLGELTDRAGLRWDIQLKGSGRSAYSRGGDGRCAIGPAVREFVMSEAMQALGVPTTRCLAVVSTGESVNRQRALPGAVVTRVASSHLRVGNFQFFAARGDADAVRTLSEFAIERHFPDIEQQGVDRTIALLDRAIERQIQLIVQWMRVGFIHGVMNTDNTAISGETIDYGPCAMMGVFDPQTVYSSIDQGARYAFGNQPAIAQWNMARLAECLLLLIDEKDPQQMGQVEALIHDFPQRYQQAYMTMMAGKFGFAEQRGGDEELIASLLEQFTLRKVDYTIGFDLLTRSLTCETASAQLSEQLEQGFGQWRARLDAEAGPVDEIAALMRRHNPCVIPRNHHIEAVIKDAEETGLAGAAQEMLAVLRSPYQGTAQTAKYQSLPADGDEHYQTFCGT